MTLTSRSLVSALVLAGAAGTAAFVEHRAEAGGLYISQRGVRALGRGGAFVAGADDLNAITYNPANIYDAGSQFLFDASWVNFNSSYTREALLRQIDPNTGDTVATYEQTFETVNGSSAFLPIPTIVGSFSPHPDWMLAFGAYVPYAAIPTYPDKTDKGEPAPQRYSLLTLDGSVLAVLGGWVAWAPIKQLRVGLGVEFLVGSFAATQVMSGCIPERFFCSPEDPSWDVLAQINAAPIITPSGNLGITWEFVKNWRLGGSFHLPFWINAPATIKTRLPTAPVFDKASQEGEDANVSFALPFNARLGLESRDLTKGLRMELAGSYEHWEMHDTITVSPDDVSLQNLPGFPKDYFIPDVTIPRGAQNAIAVMFGAEYSIKASEKVDVTPRLGVNYETSAIPPEFLSVLTIDSNKVTPTVGVSVRIGQLRLDAVYAHTFAETVEVPAKDARVVQTVPLNATPPKNPDYINGGTYSWDANVVGLGMTWTFGHPKPAEPVADKPKDDGRPTTDEPQLDKKKGDDPSAPKDEPAPPTPPEKKPDEKKSDQKKPDEKAPPAKTPPAKTPPKK
ncbi:MAG: outer membrane protein transport protein [Polyangiaceae bacterium]